MKEFVDLANSGTHGERGWPNSTYCASKIGVSALTRIQQRSLDLERPGEDIAINHVHPGYVQTGMTSGKGNKYILIKRTATYLCDAISF